MRIGQQGRATAAGETSSLIIAASGPALHSGRPELAVSSATAPIVAADPQLARLARIRQLISERFHIAPATADAPPHTISADEARKLATLLCNVLSGHGQLTFDAQRLSAYDLYNRALPPLGPRTAALAETLMLNDLICIAQTRVGRALLRDLTQAEHRTTIVMDGADMPSAQALNASPSTTKPAATTVYFTPGISYARADWSEFRDDMSPWELTNPSHSVLLHELLHARGAVLGLRDATDVEAQDGVPGDVGKVSREEHRVIGLGKYAGDTLTQTVYVRERNAIAKDGLGATKGDAALVARTAYSGDQQRAMAATRDPVHADLAAAMILDTKSDMPAHACAWVHRNRGMVRNETFVDAVRRATTPSYAAEVAQALTLPREAAWQSYVAWVTGG